MALISARSNQSEEFCRRLNVAGRVFHEAGQILCYHNHHIEFQRLAGKPVLEIIYAETDPRYLQGEPDTYWVQHGGGDPVAWCERLNGRLPVVHLKDYTVPPDNKISTLKSATAISIGKKSSRPRPAANSTLSNKTSVPATHSTRSGKALTT